MFQNNISHNGGSSMFFKKTAADSADLNSPNTVIGKGVYLEAVRMTGQESIRIDGMYKGAIEIEGSLVLGDSGNIIGDVIANYFLVAGEMNGNIKCTSQLHLASTARVSGDIQTPSLVVDEGSEVTGRYLVGVNRLPHEALLDREEILMLQNNTIDIE